MNELSLPKDNKQILRTITVISIVVPVLVAVLLFLPFKLDLPKALVMSLPPLNALINSLTSILLILALVFVKQGKIDLHKKTMFAALALGALFLLSYVTYHASAPSTKYGDINGDMLVDAAEKALVSSSAPLYYFILLTHIVLAAVVLPFVLLAVYAAMSGKVGRHQKIVRWAYPIWLYVSITGVVVYAMISPFYQG